MPKYGCFLIFLQIYLATVLVNLYLVNLYLVNLYLVNLYLVNLYLVNLYLVNLYLVFSQIRIGVYEVMWSSVPTLTGKQRCGRCRIHGSGEIQGTVDIGGAGTAAAIDPKRPAFRSGNHSGAHLAPD